MPVASQPAAHPYSLSIWKAFEADIRKPSLPSVSPYIFREISSSMSGNTLSSQGG